MLSALPPALPQSVRRCAAWLQPRRTPALAVALGLALVMALALAGSKMSTLVPLFSTPLHPSQAIEVERALTIWNEGFSADQQHAQIFVNANRRRDVLLRLTLAGLPHRYVPTTADVLDQPQNALVPQTVIDDRRRAGIEGDLIAGLRRINGVADASIIIAPAVDDPFGDSRTQAAASVQVVMQSGAQLSTTAVGGIKRFVAASYPGLAADRVVVVDGSGSAVSAQAPVADRASSREARLQASIQSALDAVFGVGAAIVRVSVRSSGEERSQQSTRITPHGLLEADSGKEQGADSGKHFERVRSRERYAYDTVVESRAAHADAIAHVAVAVFLDAHTIGADRSALVADLVRAAAGAELASGDEVVVRTLPFRDHEAVASSPRWASLRRILAPALILIGLGVLGLAALRSHAAAQVGSETAAAVELHGALQRELPHTAAYVLSSMPKRVRDHVLREYPVDQRERILRHMNGRAHE